MATIERVNIGNLQDKITVKISKEDYLPTFDKALKQFAKTANIPGFRKGMVPAGMVKKMYGQSIFGDEIFRTAGNELEQYLRNEKIEIFAQPMMLPSESPLNIDMNNPSDFTFDFEVGLKPDFKIDWFEKNSGLTQYKVNVTDKTVEDETARIRKRFGSVEDMTAVSGEGDVIYSTFEPLDAEGNKMEDVQPKEDTRLFEDLPNGLGELIKGKAAGEYVDFKPSDVCSDEETLNAFMSQTLKAEVEAKDFLYRMTITKVGQTNEAPLDVTLFAQVFPNDDIQSADDFKAKLKAELEKEYDRVAIDRLNNEVFEGLVHNTNIELPVEFLKRWLQTGQEQKKTSEEVEKEWPGFEHQLRWQLISDQLIIENNIQVTKDEVLDDVKSRVLAYFGMTIEDDAPWIDGYMQKVMEDNKTMEETFRRLMVDKLFTLLRSKITPVEQQIDEEEFFKLPAPGHHHH